MGRILLTVLCVIAVTDGFVNEIDEPDVFTLQKELTAVKSQVTQLQQLVHTLNNQLNATTSLANQAVSLSKQSPIGFTASLTSTLTNLGTHQHVIFDNVVSNVGNAYSSRDGHFSAPAVGLYSFFLTATNVPGYSASLSLMLNGLTKAVTLAHGTSNAPGQWETSTCSVVLMLARGDEVWAQNEAAFSPVEQLDGHLYSSFGGFLVQAY